MARVFDVPRYKDDAKSRYETAVAGSGSACFNAFVLGSHGFDKPFNSSDFVHAGIAVSTMLADWERSFDIGVRSEGRLDSARALREALLAIRSTYAGCTEHFDDDAVARLYCRMITGKITVRAQRTAEWTTLCGIARRISALGCAASFASPARAGEAVSGVRLFDWLDENYPVHAANMATSEVWRFGLNSGRARDHLRDIEANHAIADPDNFRVDRGAFPSAFPDLVAYTVMGLSIIVDGDSVYIMSQASISEMADCLWSVGQTLIAAVQGPHDTQARETAALMSINWIASELQADYYNPEHVSKIAKHMKTCYAMFLADYKRDPKDSFAADQVRDLKAAAIADCKTAIPFFEIMSRFSGEVQVEFGSAWNNLPGHAASPAQMDLKMIEEHNSPRSVDEEAWRDFTDYAYGVISAHILVKHPNSTGTWKGAASDEDPEDLPWVRSCRSGLLSYPPRGSKLVYTSSLPWIDHLSNWFWTIADVTHVNREPSDYESTQSVSALRRDDTNELIYGLKCAPLLSRKLTPAQVSKAWRSGEMPGEALLLVAAKNENTKAPGKHRGTFSADDQTRECISELEVNFPKLAQIIEGVTSGGGRAFVEGAIGSIIVSGDSDMLLISLDIKGWSQNADREHHNTFLDGLVDFFDAPGGTSVRTILEKTTMINSRRGYHSVWSAKDGTFQGFTGTGDSIMHSLIAQWAFVRAREKGHFPAKSRCAKVTLIDDILMRLNGASTSTAAAFRAIATEYMSLGYTPEAVKTLAATKKGHFLNRLYHAGFEVVTASKIFARANREYTSKFAGVWSIVDSCFSSHLGAADRGHHAIGAYTSAVWRALTVVSAAGLHSSKMTADYQLVAVWMPRGLRCHGFPNFTQWATRECADSTTSGVATPVVLARIFGPTQPEVSSSIMSLVHGYSSQELAKRSAKAWITDPMSLRAEGLIDPGLISNRLCKEGMKGLARSEVFSNLLSKVDDPGYARAIQQFLEGTRMPAAMYAAIAESLPHSVVESMVAAAASSDTIAMTTSYKNRHSATRELRKANNTSVNAFNFVPRPHVDPGAFEWSASRIVAEMRKRNARDSGWNASSFMSASALDLLCNIGDQEGVKVIIPKCDSKTMHMGVGKHIKRRTHNTEALITSASGRTLDRQAKCLDKAVGICAILRANGISTAGYTKLFNSLWVGNRAKISVPIALVSGCKPNRLAARLSKRTYTASLAPNVVGSIIVNANALIHSQEGGRHNMDWLSLIYTLKVAAYLDMEIGCVSDETRNYSIRMGSPIHDFDQDWWDLDDDFKFTYPGVIADAQAFADRASNIFGGCRHIPMSDEDMAELGVALDSIKVSLSPAAFLSKLDIKTVLRESKHSGLVGMGVAAFRAPGSRAPDVSSGNAAKPRAYKRLNDFERSIADALRDAAGSIIAGHDAGRTAHFRRRIAGLVNSGLVATLSKWGIGETAATLVNADADEAKYTAAMSKVTSVLLSSSGPTGSSRSEMWASCALRMVQESTADDIDKTKKSYLVFMSSALVHMAASDGLGFSNTVLAGLTGVSVALRNLVRRSMSAKGPGVTEAVARAMGSLSRVGRQSDVRRAANEAADIMCEIVPEDWNDRACIVFGCASTIKRMVSFCALDVGAAEVARQHHTKQSRVVAPSIEDASFSLTLPTIGAITMPETEAKEVHWLFSRSTEEVKEVRAALCIEDDVPVSYIVETYAWELEELRREQMGVGAADVVVANRDR
jgi:hypothetical protein